MMLLAGIPDGFRLALVSNVARIRWLFVDLQRDLWRVSIQAALFDDEAKALEWLPAEAATSVRTSQRAADAHG